MSLNAQTSSYQYILFDWDGCLAQTLGLWMSAFKKTLKQFGLFAKEQVIAQQFGDKEGLQRLGVSDADHENFIESLLQSVNAELPSVMLYPGAQDLIYALKAHRANIALVTSSPSESLKHALRNSDLEDHLDIIVTAKDVTHHKPHPESIELALAKMNGTKDKAIMIGDSSKDLGAAKNAGIDSILVYPDSHSIYYDLAQLQQFEPTYVCKSFDDVKRILLPSAVSFE